MTPIVLKSCCCQSCSVGTFIPRWHNVTVVNQSDGATPPNIVQVAPFERFFPQSSVDASTYCTTPGFCYSWLAGSDLNGLSTQRVTNYTNDIVSCPTPDTTHYTIDHNCFAELTIAATAIDAGKAYQIATVGSTNFVTIGAATSTVGVNFVATAAGTGSGTVKEMVDMRSTLRGGQWVAAQKNWHGIFNVSDRVDPNVPSGLTFDPDRGITGVTTPFRTAAPGTKYRKAELTVTGDVRAGTHLSADPTGKWHQVQHCVSEVNQLSGVRSKSGDWSITTTPCTVLTGTPTDPADFTNDVFNWLATLDLTNAVSKFVAYVSGSDWSRVGNVFSESPIAAFAAYYINNLGDRYNIYYPEYVPMVVSIDVSGHFSFTVNGHRDDFFTYDSNGHVTNTGDINAVIWATETETLDINASGGWDYRFWSLDGSSTWRLAAFPFGYANNQTYSASLVLSEPYSAADCETDRLKANAKWDMSDFNLASFRKDEQLANVPICIYDEISPQPPDVTFDISEDGNISPSASGIGPLTDDLTVLNYQGAAGNFVTGQLYEITAVNDTDFTAIGASSNNVGCQFTASGHGTTSSGGTPGTATAKRLDHDPLDYVWVYGTAAQVAAGTASTTAPSGFTGGIPGTSVGAALIEGLWSGTIISHTSPGSDRLFDFGFFDSTDLGGGMGTRSYYGALSNSSLPSVTERWQTKSAAATNLPQGWTRGGDILTGGKYAEATQKWKSVNYGRPCGWDKYAIDQTTAGLVKSAGSGTFVVWKAETTTADFPSSGYVAVTGDYAPGIYQVTGAATDNHDGTFTIPVGAKIDDLPTGGIVYQDYRDSVNWIGWLRWPSTSGICGRAAITTTHDAGTGLVTITSAALPTLRLDPVTGLISVDIYNAGNNTLTPDATVNLTRVSDTSFTVSHAAMPNAAYMTGAGYNWQNYDDSTKYTGVHLQWRFNLREVACAANVAGGGSQANFEAAFGTYPPTYYASVPGCISQARAQFDYPKVNCAVVAILPPSETDPTPDSPIETFKNEKVFATPPMSADTLYGNVALDCVEMVMVDPFWQSPFNPWTSLDVDGDGNPSTPYFDWTEDDGGGHGDGDIGVNKYYAHRPWVEAATDIPAGKSLPSGVTLFYAAANVIAPTYAPAGIGQWDASLERPWGFTAVACRSTGRWAAYYATFTPCP